MSPSDDTSTITPVAHQHGAEAVFSPDWDARKLGESIYNAGTSPSAIADMLGVTGAMVPRALATAESRAICYFVAGLIGVPPGDIWPQFRSVRNGGTVRRGRRG